MRTLFCILIALLAAFSGAQNYAPRSGEVVMKLAIEGRGNVFILLHTKEAPKTTAHIIKLVGEKFYDGQKFYKVIRSPKPYLVQIGDPLTKDRDVDSPGIGTHGSGATVPYEDSGFSHSAGAVGLGTLQDQHDTGDCHFYILMEPQKFLDGTYTVFGQVVSGMDVVGKVQLGDKVTSATILVG